MWRPVSRSSVPRFSQDSSFPVSSTGEKLVTSGTTYTLQGSDGIAPSVSYYIRVFAYNTEGFGNPCGSDGLLCDGSVVQATSTA